jgi:hypothetical protein
MAIIPLKRKPGQAMYTWSTFISMETMYVHLQITAAIITITTITLWVQITGLAVLTR